MAVIVAFKLSLAAQKSLREKGLGLLTILSSELGVNKC